MLPGMIKPLKVPFLQTITEIKPLEVAFRKTVAREDGSSGVALAGVWPGKGKKPANGPPPKLLKHLEMRFSSQCLAKTTSAESYPVTPSHALVR